VAIPKSAAASLEALANFALDRDEASAAALAPEDMDLIRGDDGACKPYALCGGRTVFFMHVHASCSCGLLPSWLPKVCVLQCGLLSAG
jgi:hypothetical protein